MADLVEKYFRQDLSEEEDRVLTQELLNSDEASEKFLRLAEEAYVRYGLPPADWEGPIPRILPNPPAGGWNHWFGLSMIVLGLAAGFYYWYHWRSLASVVQAPSRTWVAAGNSDLKKTSKKVGSTTVQHSSHGEIISSFSRESSPDDPSSKANAAPNGRGEGAPGSATSGSPSPPAPLSSQASQSDASAYSKISVDVSLSGPETLAVRVFDHHGTPVALLYSGPVAAGQWTFGWNGKTSAGAAAPPGYYQIEVKSGSNIQRKNVQIR